VSKARAILEKVKAERTRPGEINGEAVRVCVHSGAQLKAIIEQVQGNLDDKAVAAVLAGQFLDEDGDAIFTADWLMSDECPNVLFVELAKLFIEVNSGTWKKKG